MSIEKMELPAVWEEIDRVANANPDVIADTTAAYTFEITDATTTYSVHLDDDAASVQEGAANDAVATLTMNEKNFKKLLLGNLNATTAFMTGRLKVNGSVGYALKLEAMLKKLPFQSYGGVFLKHIAYIKNPVSLEEEFSF